MTGAACETSPLNLPSASTWTRVRAVGAAQVAVVVVLEPGLADDRVLRDAAVARRRLTSAVLIGPTVPNSWAASVFSG